MKTPSKHTLLIGSGCLAAALGTYVLMGPLSSSHPSSASSASSDKTSSASSSSDRKEETSSPKAASSLFADLRDPTIPYQLKVEKLRQIDPATLGLADIESLYECFKHQPLAHQKEHWWVVINEIMEQCRRHGIGADRYTDTLCGIITEPDAPEVMRDYAIQHLSQWINPRPDFPGAPYEQDEKRITQAQDIFLKTLQDPTLHHTSLPGTTLAALGDLHQSGYPFEETFLLEELQPWLQQAIDGKLPLSKINRLSAIGSAAHFHFPSLQPQIATLARQQEIDPSLKLNAIAALGHLGTAEDQLFLTELSQSSSRYQHAAKAALKHLSNPNR